MSSLDASKFKRHTVWKNSFGRSSLLYKEKKVMRWEDLWPKRAMQKISQGTSLFLLGQKRELNFENAEGLEVQCGLTRNHKEFETEREREKVHKKNKHPRVVGQVLNTIESSLQLDWNGSVQASWLNQLINRFAQLIIFKCSKEIKEYNYILLLFKDKGSIVGGYITNGYCWFD